MPTRCLIPILAVAVCSAAAAETPPRSADPAHPQSLDISSIISMVGEMGVGPPANGARLPDFAQVTRDMESARGLFTLWYYPPGAKDKDQERLLCQIPASFLGEQFMLSTSFAGGGFLTGFPLDERVVKWELLDRQLLLVEPETRYVADPSKEVSDAVRRTYPGRIRVAAPLLTRAPNGDPVIDLGPLLKSNFADIGWTVFMGPGGFLGQPTINSALSKWTKRKAFELNVEIGVELAVARRSPPGSYDKRLVHYSFWRLPRTDYKPRAADDRIGYFLTANRDWSKPTSERDIFNRYINRWHLVKRDPSLSLCEPRQPIIFYIEKTVPVKYRRAVREGILEWNRAFEQIGFVNAIEVRQQTDDNEWKDIDPEDMRYSFIRWIVTGMPFAMGPHRANPFTGQIYESNILFDDSMVRYFEQEMHHFVPTDLVTMKFGDPVRSQFLERFPELRRPPRDWEDVAIGMEEERELLRRAERRARDSGRHVCRHADGMKHQLALGRAVLSSQPRETIDRFLHETIREVVMHEVGHALGLRHNFKASSIYSLEEIQRRRASGEPTTGSVMDYNPALLFGADPASGHFVTPTIGPYDYWAIEYGYRPFDDSFTRQKPKEKEAAEPPAAEPEAAADTSAPTPLPEMPSTAEMARMAAALADERGEIHVDLSEIPPEILAQIPDDIRRMLETGPISVGNVTQFAGGGPPGPSRPQSGSPFAMPPAGEQAMLREIASRSAEPELVYATDEDTTWLSSDPRTARFDAGADPIEWARARIELVDRRLENILEWAVNEQESWYHLRSAFMTLWIERAFVFDYVGRYVGGVYFHRHRRGDPDAAPPFVLVEPQRQRAALEFIVERLYSDSFFETPIDVLNHLAPPRWWHDGAYVTYALDFPVRDMIGLLQWWNLFDRLDPYTLRRIHDNELKTDAADKLTVAEYLQRLQQACWSDATDAERVRAGTWSDAKPFVSDVRRSLQREYLGLMEPLARGRPGRFISPDLHAMLQHSLRTLAAQLAAVLEAGEMDFASKAHLTSCRSRIERMLSAELREHEPAPYFGGAFLHEGRP